MLIARRQRVNALKERCYRSRMITWLDNAYVRYNILGKVNRNPSTTSLVSYPPFTQQTCHLSEDKEVRMEDREVEAGEDSEVVDEVEEDL